MDLRNKIHLSVAAPFLVLGWIFLIAGIFQLAFASIGVPADNPGEAAIWSFMFGFGALSVATLVASRVKFLSSPVIRRMFQYSLATSSILFLGYLSSGIVFWLVSH